VSVSPSTRIHKAALLKKPQPSLARKYLRVNAWIWNRLPASLRRSRIARTYGVHLHRLTQLTTTRWQNIGTYFFRNRPELELLVRLLNQFPPGSTIDMGLLGCSKGPEVYSFSYAIRTQRPDLNLRLCALDISKEALEFAETGVYSLKGEDGWPDHSEGAQVAVITSRDQPTSIFERMSAIEMETLFGVEGEQVRVRPRFRDGISWRLGDAGDPGLPNSLGLKDIVVANRFLCHMAPNQAEACLCNLARLVKSGGYLFVSGVDLAVRSKVASEYGWRPVTDLIEEIHEGDPSLRRDWPLRYWGLEPLDRTRADWRVRYASVFQLPEHA
jgi:chemotaxis methyl-accepting protein methylase